MSQQPDDLWLLLLLNPRSRLWVCDVRLSKGIVELKRAEVAAATIPPAVVPTAKGACRRPDLRVEVDAIDLAFGRAFRKRTSSGKPLRMLIARPKPASKSSCSFLAKVHGQSVLRHGQSFARNSQFQRTLGGSARTGHGLQTPTG